MCVNHVPDKGHAFRIYEDFMQLNNKDSTIGKWGKDLNK